MKLRKVDHPELIDFTLPHGVPNTKGLILVIKNYY